MKKMTYSLAGLLLSASAAAHAQPADVPGAEEQGAEAAQPADPAADAAATPAQPATPAEPAPPAAAAVDGAVTADADVTEAEIDSFAKATVKLREIQEDATIAEDQKQSAMAAAVAEAGLDPVKYNAIGKAAQADATLRAKVQTAMSKYAPQPSDG